MIEELFFFQYKIVPYLCGMKTSILFLSTVCALLQTMPAHAQFNTIGMTNSKSIKTINPPKSNETLTDSTETNKPAPQPIESTVTHQASNSTLDNSNTAPLISPPLKNIRIGSGFGMRTTASTFPLDTRMSILCFLVLWLKLGRMADRESS